MDRTGGWVNEWEEGERGMGGRGGGGEMDRQREECKPEQHLLVYRCKNL